MTIGAQGGKPIRKNGKIAIGCGCCDGGTACCKDPTCLYLTHDIRFTISREWPPSFGESEQSIFSLIAHSPYVGSFIVPYVDFEPILFQGQPVGYFRRYRLALNITEQCLVPSVEFRIQWQGMDTQLYFSFVYNHLHLEYGSGANGECVSRTMAYSSSFAGGCGIWHNEAWQRFQLGYVLFPAGRFGRLTAQFVERSA